MRVLRMIEPTGGASYSCERSVKATVRMQQIGQAKAGRRGAPRLAVCKTLASLVQPDGWARGEREG